MLWPFCVFFSVLLSFGIDWKWFLRCFPRMRFHWGAHNRLACFPSLLSLALCASLNISRCSCHCTRLLDILACATSSRLHLFCIASWVFLPSDLWRLINGTAGQSERFCTVHRLISTLFVRAERRFIVDKHLAFISFFSFIPFSPRQSPGRWTLLALKPHERPVKEEILLLPCHVFLEKFYFIYIS